MADEEEYEEVIEYYTEETVYEEVPGETITEVYETTTTRTSDYGQSESSTPALVQPQPAKPMERKKVIRKKVDSSKFMTPYIQHSQKMQDLFSPNKYKENYEKAKGQPYAITSDTPELRRIKKVQDQLSEVKYRMDGDVAKTICHVDEKAKDIEHAKKVSQQVSKIAYKKGLTEQQTQFTSLPDPPDVEFAKKVTNQVSKHTYKVHPDKTKFTAVTDTPVLLQAQLNTKQLSDLNYKAKHEGEKFKCNVPADAPEFIQHRVNAYNLSDREYRKDYEKSKTIYTAPLDMLQVTQAKKSQEIASDVDYKHVLHNYSYPPDSINLDLAKKAYALQSDVEYKADYNSWMKGCGWVPFGSLEMEKAKRASDILNEIAYKAKGEEILHKYNLPADLPQFIQAKVNAYNISENMYKADLKDLSKKGYDLRIDAIPIKAAKAARQAASDVCYKRDWHDLIAKGNNVLADAIPITAAKSSRNIASDNVYKDEYNSFFKGIGWIPIGSLEVEKAKKAGDALNERKYRQHPDTIKFTSVPDSMGMVLAQQNTKQLSDLNYKVEGEKLKHKYTMDPELPQFIQAKVNAINMSDAHYKADWKKTLAKGYDLRPDAIPIVAAKSSRNIASDFKYKEAYEKARGKQIGFLSLQDDPKLVHYMNVAKIQSDREYKKGYEASKTRYHTPLDMFSVTAAKKSQEVATNTNYRQPYHNYTLLPDALNVEHSRNAMQIQSDNLYKSDFTNWMKGIGWVPIDSLEVEKAKKAGEILSERKYRQHPEKLKFTYSMDTMEQALNKSNKLTMDKKLYKAGWEEEKKKGYDLKPDAISIQAAKASRDIASDYKYKQAYEQAKGKHIGFRSLEDDPKLVHFMQVAKMQSDREYKKGYEKSKTSFHTPVDMFSVVAAKKSQEVATNANYRNIIHTYNMLPDAMSFELAKNMMQIQSDNQYKADYADFMKGIGWLPLGSLEAEKNKKAMEIISEKKYRQHPDTLKYSTLMDSMNMVLAQNNAKIMNEHLYKQAWEADKTKVHIMPDIPEIVLAKANAINMSDKLYKLSLEESKKKGYDLRTDAIPIQAAKASRDIASDYKYKHNYEKEKGKMVGFRSLEDDPKLVHSMQVAKMQSDREYKKNYEKTKTSYHTPADMLSVTAAKDAQANITNTNYKRLIHKYILLPDAMNIELTRNMNHIQSDNQYKQDYNEWYKGLGWSPAGSLEVEKAKKATEYASDQKYRQHPSSFQFKKLTDSMDMVLAKQNAHTMNKKFYRLGWEEALKKGYDLPVDAISVQLAKTSRDIASDFKYKQGYRKQLGHHIGFLSVQDDPKLVLSMNVAKMQSEREYKKDFEKWKTKYTSPVDMLGVVLAKKCQALVSDVDYRNYLHQWTCLPDQNDVIQAKKVYELQSENMYKSDLEWLRGIGWSPLGSLEAEKNKRASEIISEKKYRQPPDRNKFTSIPDAMDIVLAKTNAKNRSDRLYREAWDKDKTQIHIMPDTPDIVLAKANLINTSDKIYRMGYEELKKKGYDLPVDAIPIKAAKASREIASEYKYKEGFRKQLGHHIGARNIKDDPKMMWSMHVAKIQSDREYKKDFEKWKTKYSSPVDMLGVVLAKKCQTLVSDADYRNYLHQWTCLPDQNDVIHARQAYDLQSDNLYKADLQWLKGIGWIPSGSLEDEKNKRATQILSEHVYRQHPDKFKFSSLMDSMPMVLAKNNAITMNHKLYKLGLEEAKRKGYDMRLDAIPIKTAKASRDIASDSLYKLANEEAKKKGYDLRSDAIPIVAAKASRDIASDPPDKFKFTSVTDSLEQVLAKSNALNMNKSLYKLANEEAKKKGYDLRVDAIPIVAAKASRDIASDYKYKDGYRKQLGHHIGARNIEDDPKMMWSMHVAKIQSDREYKKDFEKWKTRFSSPVYVLRVELAKKCQTFVSDVDYRNYLHQWTCLPDQNDVIHARQAYDLQSDNVYKSDLQWLRGIGWVPIGSLDVVKCKRAAEILSDNIYRQPPDKFKFTSVTDSLEQVLAKNNALNMNKSLYRQAMEEAKKEGYDLRSDAIPIVAAKASRDIASDDLQKEQWLFLPQGLASQHLLRNLLVFQFHRGYPHRSSRQRSSPPPPPFLCSGLCLFQYKYKEAYRKQLGHHIGARAIHDDPKMMWSLHIAKVQSDREYKKEFEKYKTRYSSPVDMLGIVLAKKCQTLVSDVDYKHPLHEWTCLPDQNDVIQARKAYDLQSDNLYKADLEWMKGIGWVPIGSLEVVKAKRATEILSDNIYRQRPDTLKFTSITDSLEQVLAKNNAINMNKSDREYKKDFEKWKTKYSSPVDMLGVVLAKKCQILVSDIDYKHPLHEWTCLPDQNDVIQARKAYDLQSDAVYKADLEWLRGIGWVPIGSVEVEKVKRAGEILSDRKYRQPADQLKFTCITDTPEIVLAKNNAITMSKHLYTEAWDADKASIHVMPDTPEILLAKSNSANISQKLYTKGWDESKMKDYDLREDAISIKSAKASRDIASDYKYKEAYEKQKGHHIGAQSVEDDPRIMCAMHAGKIHSDREYKKEFQKWKTKFSSPVDMLGLVLAKKCQTLVSDVDYRNYLHNWTCLPDQNDIIQAKKAYELQSDSVYKADLEWLRGIGWMPDGSVEMTRVKGAQDLVNERLYRTRPEALKFTSIVDTPEVVLAKNNSLQMSERLYQEAWNKDKTNISIPLDTPAMLQAQINALQISNYKYKEGYRKQLGHHVGFRSLQDDPKLVWSIHAAKIQSDREYKKAYEKSKGIYNTPLDMMSIVQAKKCQVLVSDIDYRNYLHQWTCLPDQNDVIQAKKAYELQSDNVYKSDLEWMKGIGWLTEGSVEVMRVKNAQNLLNERLYRIRPEAYKFTSIVDTPEVILAKTNALQISQPLYRDAWDKEKANVNVPADTPVMLQSKLNAIQISNKQYQKAWEDVKMTGYDIRADAIGIQHAKASRDIASDYLYKTAYEKQKGHYIGCPSAKEDPKLVWAANVLKMQNDRLYKKAYNDHKAKISIPVDMVSINAAKEGQALASNVDYRQYLHQWSCFPDQNDVIQARKAYDLQSDAIYKADLEWLRGIGWMPEGSPEVLRVKNAQEILCDSVYRTPVVKLKYTSIVDTPEVVLAKSNAENISILKYKAEHVKQKGHYVGVPTMRDDPKLVWFEHAGQIQNDRLYKENYHKSKAKINIPADMVSVVAAKEGQNLVSDIDYRHYLHQWTCHPDQNDVIQAKIAYDLQSDNVYKADLEWLRGIGWIPLDSVDHVRVTKNQEMVNQILYKGAWEGTKAYGYTLDERYIPIVGAKHADLVNSELKYKETYEKQKGHYLAGKEISEFPGVVHCLDFQQMRSALNYRRDYEDTKANVHIPNDMMNHVLAKRCQYILSDLEYRHYFHQWTSLPEEPNVIRARNAQEILSDNVYKDDLNWLKGIGCYVWDTPQILHAKKSYDLQSQLQYTAASKDNLQNYNLVTDTPVYVTALQSGINASENIYKEAWDKVKATSYNLPTSTLSLTHAKNQKHLASHIKYREEYEKFKALYTLPKSVEDDPNTARCLRVGKLNIDRLYRSVYEKNKMKIHIVPDMVEMVTAKDSQKKVSEIDYRLHLHEWICHPDLQVNSHVRKVTDQISDIVYKDDLTWLKGIGCYVWDTPEILHAKHAYDLRNDIKYKAHVQKTRNDYKLVTDTPVYVQAVKSGKQLSDAVYHYDYVHSVRGKVAPTTKTVDLDRALHAYKLQSENLYKKGLRFLPTGYRLPVDTPHFNHTKDTRYMSSYFKYKEAYEHIKANGYTLGPKDVPFVHVRRVNNVTSERLYRELYHKLKDKIHTTPDTPEIRQVKKTQEAVSELIYKSDFFKMQGHMISLPYTPQVLHCRYVGDITSDIKYKEDLQILKGLGCFLYDTPDMVRSRHLRKLWSNYLYTDNARKMRDKYKVVLDTPEYRKVQELKTHLSEKKYRADYEQRKDKYHLVVDEPRHLVAKTAGDQISQIKYRKKYEKSKDKFTSVVDTPEHLRTTKVNKQISDILYKLEYNKARPRGYTTIHDTPMLLHVRKVKDEVSDLKYKEVYQRNKSNCTIKPDAVHIKAAKDAYKVNTNFEYKLDREFLKGCKLSVTDDKDMVLALRNSLIESDLKYKEKHVKERGTCHAVPDTPQILLAKTVSNLVSENKYKDHVKKHLAQGSYTTLPETRDTVHVKAVTKHVSDTNYKKKFVKEKGKSNYSIMQEPPEVKHAMEVAKKQSDVAYKKDAKENLHYTTVADRPDIKKATQAAKQASEVEYRAKHRKEGSHGLSMLGRPDIEMAKKAAKLSSQVKYRENFDKEKGKTPKYNPKDSQLYKTMKDANNLASEYQYKKNYEKSKGHYHTIPDNLEQLHLKEATELQSIVKYKEKYEKERGKPMLDFETPTYITAKESQQMQSGKEYRKDLEESIRGRGLTEMEDTPDMLRAKNATQILNEKEYKRDLELEVKGRGLNAMANETPDFMRAKNATDIASQIKYKQSAEMEKANFTSVVDTPEIIHAQQVKNLSSQKKYKEDAEKSMSYYETVLDTPEMQRVRENQKNFSLVLYKEDVSPGTAIGKTPEMLRVKQTQDHISSVKYKEAIGQGTPIPDLPEVKRVKETQKHISSVLYSDSFRKQIQGKAAYVLDTPEMRRVRETQRHISTVKYHEDFEKHKGCFTPVVTDPITERVKKNTQDFSDINYRGIQRKVVEMEQKRNDQDQDTITGLRVWRTNPGSVFDYDPAEDNIQSRSLHMINVQAQRRSREQSRSASALSISGGEDKSEHSADQRFSTYSDGGAFFSATSTGYKHVKTTELPQQRSSSVATQQTTLSSIPSHPSTAGKIFRAMYDYMAADADEVSFKDGDAIVNAQAIDEGWMYGTVQRTGRTGMLPANYVEAV
ncbi:nebulin [Cricetulus griseus]